MRTAAQVLTLQHTSKPVIAKNSYKGKTKKKPQSTEELDYSRVRVKINGHPALALVDLQTTGGDLINAQFVHLYGLPTYRIDKKSLKTAIKGSKGVIEKACDVQMDYGGYTETRTLYVAHLAGWDMILGKAALTARNALIPAGPKPITIQPEGMARFAFNEWRKAGLATEQVTSAALFIEDEVPDYLLPLCELMVSAMSLGECREFNLYVEFAQLFPATTPNELPPLRTINHRICPKPGPTWVPKWRPSPSQFYSELTKQLNEEEASGRIYRAEHDTNAVVLFVQAKRDDPTKPRCLLDARDRNDAVDPNHAPIPSIAELMELVAARNYWSKIDIADGYHNIRIEEDSEQHSTLLTHMGYYRSRIMQQGDRNAPATMVRAMFEIFKDMVFKDLVIYIDDIIIFSNTYNEHVTTLRKVLQRLLHEKFWLKASKCQFFTKRLDILGHILTPDGFHMDPKKSKKVLDIKFTSNRRELRGIFGIVIFLSKFCPQLASWSSTLSELQGENAPWRWTDTHTRALEKIKELVNSPQILRPWDHFSEPPKSLVYDASDIGLGSWIGQGELGSIRPCRFHSRKFSPAQPKYPTYQKELFTIVDSLKFIEAQLGDHKFTVLTDHQPLLSFLQPRQTSQKLA